MQITYSSSTDANAAAGKGEFAALLSTNTTRDEYGYPTGYFEVWGVFKRPAMPAIDFADRMRNAINRRRDTVWTGPYRGALESDVAGL